MVHRNTAIALHQTYQMRTRNLASTNTIPVSESDTTTDATSVTEHIGNNQHAESTNHSNRDKKWKHEERQYGTKTRIESTNSRHTSTSIYMHGCCHCFPGVPGASKNLQYFLNGLPNKVLPFQGVPIPRNYQKALVFAIYNNPTSS